LENSGKTKDWLFLENQVKSFHFEVRR